MTQRSYDDVDFRPWYLPDTARWLRLSLGARGLVAELVRKLDRHGRIALGEDPAADLSIILRVNETDVRKALAELLQAKRLVWDPAARVLSDPDLPARLRQGSASRMASKRARDAAAAELAAREAAALDEETTEPTLSASLDPDSVTPVTSRHTRHISSPSDLICSDLISDPEDPEEIPSAREAPDDPPPPTETGKRPLRPLAKIPDPCGPAPDWWESTLATVHQNTGVLLPAGEAWIQYAGHRASPNKRLPATREDAVYWLARVMVPEARKTAAEASRVRERDARWDADRKAQQTPATPPYHATVKRPKKDPPRMAPEDGAAALRSVLGALAPPKSGTDPPPGG